MGLPVVEGDESGESAVVVAILKGKRKLLPLALMGH
jgi:hypothetical protein